MTSPELMETGEFNRTETLQAVVEQLWPGRFVAQEPHQHRFIFNTYRFYGNTTVGKVADAKGPKRDRI